MRQDYSIAKATRTGRPRRPIEIMMTPMIDVIFLLLVFFLATSSFQVIEKLMPSGLSKASEVAGSGENVEIDPSDDAIDQVVIKLKLAGDRTVAEMNGVALADFRSLKDRLKGLSLARADVPVVIDPAAKVLAGDVVKAYDWARQAGLARVYLATRQK